MSLLENPFVPEFSTRKLQYDFELLIWVLFECETFRLSQNGVLVEFCSETTRFWNKSYFLVWACCRFYDPKGDIFVYIHRVWIQLPSELLWQNETHWILPWTYSSLAIFSFSPDLISKDGSSVSDSEDGSLSVSGSVSFPGFFFLFIRYFS